MQAELETPETYARKTILHALRRSPYDVWTKEALASLKTLLTGAPAASADEQLTRLLADAEAFTTRQTEISELRAKDGRGLSEERRAKLAALAGALAALATKDAPPKTLSPEVATSLLTHYREKAARRTVVPHT